MSHVQHAFVLCKFGWGVQPVDGGGSLAPNSIKGMIDGFVRNIHSVEAESDELSSMIGAWSWSKTKNYKCVKEELKKYSLCHFDKISEHPEEKRARSTADPLRLFSFSAIHSRTLCLAGRSATFRDCIVHIQKATVHGVLLWEQSNCRNECN